MLAGVAYDRIRRPGFRSRKARNLRSFRLTTSSSARPGTRLELVAGLEAAGQPPAPDRRIGSSRPNSMHGARSTMDRVWRRAMSLPQGEVEQLALLTKHARRRSPGTYVEPAGEASRGSGLPGGSLKSSSRWARVAHGSNVRQPPQALDRTQGRAFSAAGIRARRLPAEPDRICRKRAGIRTAACGIGGIAPPGCRRYDLRLHGAGERPALLRHVLQRFTMREAHAIFTPWLAGLAASTGLHYERIQIRRQRTRWGSCSRSGTISLNACLLFQSPAVVNYLLIHELVHTRHMNHSRRFWRLVERLEPGWRELDAALQRGLAFVPSWALVSRSEVPSPGVPGRAVPFSSLGSRCSRFRMERSSARLADTAPFAIAAWRSDSRRSSVLLR